MNSLHLNNSGTFTRLEDGTLVPAIPEPFWLRGWGTLWRWKPGCYQCRLKLKNRAAWEEHYIKYHSVTDGL